MTSIDLDLLCFHLSSLSADALYSLDERIHFELPKVRGRPLTEAVSAICVYLGGIAVLKRRLYCMAQIYCWLIALEANKCAARRKLGEAWHTSLLIAVEGGAYHEVHCFSAWDKMACVAIYQPQDRPSELLGRSLLEAHWDALDSRIYWDLDSAYAAHVKCCGNACNPPPT
ncbi:hypothetical protein MTO96_026534 [Rhipicephalus appendiculatus]